MDVEIYRTAANKEPFTEWLLHLRDMRARTIIRTRLNRLVLGHLGDIRFVGNGVWEMKIHHGPGYRVYFGRLGKRTVVLLAGGDKSSQQNDIHQAVTYWKEYLDHA